jgi:hypothetical protein
LRSRGDWEKQARGAIQDPRADEVSRGLDRFRGVRRPTDEPRNR